MILNVYIFRFLFIFFLNFWHLVIQLIRIYIYIYLIMYLRLLLVSLSILIHLRLINNFLIILLNFILDYKFFWLIFNKYGLLSWKNYIKTLWAFIFYQIFFINKTLLFFRKNIIYFVDFSDLNILIESW